MSDTKSPEQIEQENYDNMLNAMAEYTMHKDAEQYDGGSHHRRLNLPVCHGVYRGQ